MAILPNQDENTEKEMEVLGSEQPVQESAPTISTGIGEGSTPSTTAPSPQSSPQSKGSGQFKGIRKYVKAGEGSGERIGQALGKEFTQKAGSVGSAIEKSKQEQQQRIQDVSTGLGDARSFALQQLGSAQSGQSPQEQDAKRFQSILKEDATKDLSQSINLAQPSLQSKRLSEQASKTGTEQGRFDLLQSAFGKQGGYSRGEGLLDQLLLQRSPQAIDDLATSTQQTAKSTQDSIKQARQQYLQSLGQVKQEQTGLQQELGAGISQSQQQLETDLATRQTSLQSALKKLTDRSGVVSGLGGEVGQSVPIDSSVLEQLGIVAPELYGQKQLFVDPSKYLQFNKSTVATPEELARARALSQLSGTQQTLIPEDQLLGKTGIDRLNAAIQDAQQDFTSREGQYRDPVKKLIDQFESFKSSNVHIMGKKASEYTLPELIKVLQPMSARGAAGQQVYSYVPQAQEAISKLQDLRGQYGISGYSPDELEQTLRGLS